jgi:glyoxylase-like metal-dependent hydrolase (beta-lactamase superfamily II)
MRVVALHADVIVFISEFWQTTCTAVRSDEEGFVIDSPVLPGELEAVPGVLKQAGFPVSGLLATHADWDHLLGRFAFPEMSLGCAESTAERLRAEPGAAQRELFEFDDENYVIRPQPLALAAVQALPVPGRLALGAEHELELHPADGHTRDGMALLVPWAGTLVCGDYLSPVEIPWISEDGGADAYIATLERLRPLVARVETVVPGHGAPLPATQALEVLDQDAGYLAELKLAGAEAALPRGRASAAQRKIHRENVERVHPGAA